MHGCTSRRPAGVPVQIPILAILAAALPHFLTHSDEIWHEDAKLGLPPPSQILFKKLLKKQIYTKNFQFLQFWGL